MTPAGSFRDVHGRLVALPAPDDEAEEAVAAFRAQLNGRMAPEAVLERIRRHTALIAEARRVANA